MITPEIIEYIVYAKEKGCSMQGTEDPEVENLKCASQRNNSRSAKIKIPVKIRFLQKKGEDHGTWFSDYHTEKVKVSVKVQKQLFGLQTELQRIDVFDSDEFGRFLSSDGSIVFSEKDEFVYDEMIVHVPMAVHPHVKKVLVIGGGDGGVARELGYYDEIEQIDVVEPDRVFVEVCKEFFPDNACGLSDERVTVYYEDGLKFLRMKHDEYDLIINDEADPLRHNCRTVYQGILRKLLPCLKR